MRQSLQVSPTSPPTVHGSLTLPRLDGSIMRLVDKRFSGIARGVGTARILGRIHSAQMKFQDLPLACSFTILEVNSFLFGPSHFSPPTSPLSTGQGMDIDVMLGLDTLKVYQACVDLERNVLRIRGREVKFLDEHEILEPRTRMPESGQDHELGSQLSGLGSLNPPTPTEQNQDSSFPGQGNTLGASEGISQVAPTAITTATDITASNPEVPGIEHQAAGGPGRDEGGGGTIPRRFRPSTNTAIAFSLFCAFLAFLFSASPFDF